MTACRFRATSRRSRKLRPLAPAQQHGLTTRLARLTAALAKESPAALKYALCLLGFISPGTRLPIVELTEAAKAEVAGALAAIGDEDLVCPVESWHDHGRRGNVAATS